MYVCMYARMYVYGYDICMLYVCMHACMRVCMYVSMSVYCDLHKPVYRSHEQPGARANSMYIDADIRDAYILHYRYTGTNGLK